MPRSGDGAAAQGVSPSPPRSSSQTTNDKQQQRKAHGGGPRHATGGGMTDRTVYVGNVAPDIDEQTMHALFAHCGTVRQIRIAGYVPAHGRTMGWLARGRSAADVVGLAAVVVAVLPAPGRAARRQQGPDVQRTVRLRGVHGASDGAHGDHAQRPADDGAHAARGHGQEPHQQPHRRGRRRHGRRAAAAARRRRRPAARTPAPA
eukprot:scaffold725_cov342-Prasinococcus_capsulatus_cf.AAC.1